MREAVSSHNLILTKTELICYVFLHAYSMILQWIRVMQHQLGDVAHEEGQHVQAINGWGSSYLRLHTN